MASKKTAVIELLFNDASRWSNGVGSELVRPVVTFEEVAAAIEQHNTELKRHSQASLSKSNPANFFKDFVRKSESAEENWPTAILTAGYSGRQKTGGGDSFEFVLLPAGQTTAFAASAAIYPRNPSTTKLLVAQTLSIKRMQTALARRDENWLQTMTIGIHVLENHLAANPILDLPFTEIGHMQSNVKLRKTEIDGLYYGSINDGRVVLITLEVKGASDDVLESQVQEQVAALQDMPHVKELLSVMKTTPEDTMILPMAMKLVDAKCAANVPGAPQFAIIGKRLLYVVDYAPVPFLAGKPPGLKPRGETLFDLRPQIKGISS